MSRYAKTTVLMRLVWKWSQTRLVRIGWIVASALAVVIVGMPLVFTAVGAMAYRSQSYDMAQKSWRFTSHLVWYDRDVPHNNAGLAYYRLQHWDGAVDQFEAALKLVPDARECKVRWNLGLALSQRGDVRSTSQQLNEAVGDYTRAINVLSVDNCRNDPQYRASFEQLIQALNKKLETLVRAINEQHKRKETPTEPGSDKSLSEEEKSEDLRQRQAEYQNQKDYGRYKQYQDQTGYTDEKAW